MKLDGVSLAIGVGMGFVAATVSFIAFVLQPGQIALDSEDTVVAAVTANNRSHFFISGLIAEMSNDTIILDQTFGRPDFNDNPMVTVRLDRGAAFVACVGTSMSTEETCEESISNRLGKEPVYLCAHSRMYNGEFYAGKIWAESGCGPFPVQNE
jgi:hypothetical protein